MDETRKKRPWFQYSLATAVVVMFVAAILLGVNMHPWHPWEQDKYGWPFCALHYWRGLIKGGDQSYYYLTGTASLIADLLVAAATLVSFAVASEWLVRRRFQLRRVTKITLGLLSLLWLWLNLAPNHMYFLGAGEFVCGFPLWMYSSGNMFTSQWWNFGEPTGEWRIAEAGVHWPSVLGNALIAFAVFAIVTYVCEYCEPIRARTKKDDQ